MAWLSPLAKENEKIIALTADLGITAGLERFKTTFPERFYNVGIAEQNLIGVSAGFAAGDLFHTAQLFLILLLCAVASRSGII